MTSAPRGGPRPISAVPHRFSRPLVLTAGAALTVAAATSIALASAPSDARTDVGAFPDSAVHLLQTVRWPVAAGILLLAALHYVASAIAMRAAAGVRTPFAETMLVQLSAATANRLTPAGLGGSAVLARYLTRRAGFVLAGAVGAALTLTVLGALADLLVIALLASTGSWFGVNGGAAELALLRQHLQSLLTSPSSSWIAPVIGGALLVGLALLVRAHAKSLRGGWVVRFWHPFARLARRPRALVTLMAASAATTVILGLAFAASCALLPGPQPHLSVGGLVMAYMLGAAAAGAIPVPAGIGAAETTLTGLLVAAQVPATHAVLDVLVFRVFTFWSPAVLGIFAARRLRRIGAL
jgi:uncharacterized membrane protein YbhN (UPF0104 family)